MSPEIKAGAGSRMTALKTSRRSYGRGMAELKTSRRSYGYRFSSGSSVNTDILTARDPNGYKKEAEIGFFFVCNG